MAHRRLSCSTVALLVVTSLSPLSPVSATLRPLLPDLNYSARRQFNQIVSFATCSATVPGVNLPAINPPTTSIVTSDLSSVNIQKQWQRRSEEPKRADTNQDRLKRGLPPMPPPAFRRGLEPTRVSGALKPRQSSSPPGSGVTIKGRILISPEGNTTATFGYLARNLNAYGELYTVTTDRGTALQLSAGSQCAADGIPSTSSNNPFNIQYLRIRNPFMPLDSNDYLGAFQAPASPSPILSTGSINHLFLGQTRRTSCLAPPSLAGSGSIVSRTLPVATSSFQVATASPNAAIESAVWYRNTATGEMQLWWMNPSRTNGQAGQGVPGEVAGRIRAYLMQLTQDCLIAATADPVMFASMSGRNVTRLSFWFERDDSIL